MASEKITKFVEEIKTLTVLELNELVKAIEEEFGVSAAAPVMVAAGPAAAAAEEKTEFGVVLAVAGAEGIHLIFYLHWSFYPEKTQMLPEGATVHPVCRGGGRAADLDCGFGHCGALGKPEPVAKPALG